MAEAHSDKTFDFNSEEEALALSDPDFESIPKEKRKKCLEYLKEQYKADWLTDGEYGRFMKARKFDQQSSWKMLEGHIEFRERINYEALTCEDCIEVLGGEYAHIEGFDREGNPMIWIDGEKFNTKWTCEEFERALGFVFREALAIAPKGRISAFFDLENYSVWKQFAPSLTRVLATMGTQTFADILASGMLYKSPFGFETVYQIAALIMDERTTKKISWHKKKESILEIIDEDNLPQRYGGKMKLGPTWEFEDKGEETGI